MDTEQIHLPFTDLVCRLKLKVNKLTSVKKQFALNYYNLPFCPPDRGPRQDSQNLGEFLAGDRILSSPYRLFMLTSMYCEQVCISNLGRGEFMGRIPTRFERTIRNNYHNNWIVDNLAAAYKREDDKTVTTRYCAGFPVGFLSEDKKTAYINNHVNIELMYQAVEAEGMEKYRIVRFTVQPFSIRHEFELLDMAEEPPFAIIKNPIASCKKDAMTHTSFEMLKDTEPALASGKVLFTYDVVWTENKTQRWSSRWDIYLTMDDAIPSKVHWLSIVNGLVIAYVLSAVLVRNFRHDLRRYSSLVTDDEETAERTKQPGWMLLQADVFRPPRCSPLLLAAACGTGAQILGTSFLTIVLSAMGMLSPANRGALLMAEILLFVGMGVVAGYVTARLYKAFKGVRWLLAAALTALGFPGVFLCFFALVNILAAHQGSSNAVTFSVLMILLVLFGISTSLVFVGAYFGNKRDAIEFPVETSSIQRKIPNQAFFVELPFMMAIGGILPFGICFVEYYFILSSVWLNQYYYCFEYLLVVFFLLVVLCAEVAMLFCYVQLYLENHQWWWRSFLVCGSSGLYLFLYSFVFFSRLEASWFSTYILYFGYMGLLSVGMSMMTGFIGVAGCLWFNMKLYSSMKAE